MKTKHEIIDFIANSYTSKTRSVSSEGGCAYLNPTGLKCAVGITLTKKAIDNYRDSTLYVQALNSDCGGLDKIQLKKFKGHALAFWVDLQRLHDIPSHWNEKGLSTEGKMEVKRLKGEYN